MQDGKGRPKTCRNATSVADFLGLEVQEGATAYQVARLVQEQIDSLKQELSLSKRAAALACEQRDQAERQLKAALTERKVAERRIGSQEPTHRSAVAI